MNEIIRLIHSLRSYPSGFSYKQVSRKDLRTILDAAVHAANTSVQQCYSIVVVEDEAMIHDLVGARGSKLLVFCVDYNRIIDLAQHLGSTFKLDDIASFVSGAVDTALAAQTAVIAAKSLGIDSRFTGLGQDSDVTRIYRLLDLPSEHCFPLIGLVLGYSPAEPTDTAGRLNGPGVIHFGQYHRLAPIGRDVLIQMHDDPDEGLDAGCADWAQLGFKHYLDWFYDEWSKREQGEPICNRNRLYETLRRTDLVNAYPAIHYVIELANVPGPSPVQQVAAVRPGCPANRLADSDWRGGCRGSADSDRLATRAILKDRKVTDCAQEISDTPCDGNRQ